jgi:hypothetical protein
MSRCGASNVAEVWRNQCNAPFSGHVSADDDVASDRAVFFFNRVVLFLSIRARRWIEYALR